MKLYYDLHIHSALSPCGDEDMTPNNIVNMARLKGLDVIAVTDHNTCKNAEAVMKCGLDAGVLVVPGMEVESMEEVHLAALFPSLETAMVFDEFISNHLPPIKNKPDIFGEQILYDENDNVKGYTENLLITATDMPIGDIVSEVDKLGGAIFPSHIDKDSYSILSNLGFFPDDIEFGAVEIKDVEKTDKLIQNHNLQNHIILHNSDAHFLWDMSERENFFETDVRSVECVVKTLGKR